jgi:hypothetical protein
MPTDQTCVLNSFRLAFTFRANRRFKNSIVTYITYPKILIDFSYPHIAPCGICSRRSSYSNSNLTSTTELCAEMEILPVAPPFADHVNQLVTLVNRQFSI